MAKKKDSLALFEVFGKDKKKDASALPGWIGPTAQVNDAQPSANKAQAGLVEQQTGVATSQLAGCSVSSKPAMSWLSGEQVISSYDGQTRVSLNATGWSIVVAAIVILLAAAFVVGRLSVTPKAPASGLTAGGSNGENPLPPLQGGAPAAGTLIEGKHYLVIQGLGAATADNKSRGEALLAYLVKHDVPAVMVTLTKSQQYVVLLDIPYDTDQDPDGVRWARQLEDMAKNKKDVPFGYNFKQGKEPWFVLFHKGK